MNLLESVNLHLMYYNPKGASIDNLSCGVIRDRGFIVMASAGHSRAQKRQPMQSRA